MKKLFDARMLVVAATAVILTIAATSVKAQIVSWNFDGYGTINGGSQYAGVVSAANWNDTYLIDGNSGNPENNLIDNSGNATTVGASFTDNSQYGYAIQFSTPAQDADGTYNKYLLNGYLNNGNGASVAISLSSIPYSSYNIVVYLSSDTAGRLGTVNVGGTTYDFSTMGPAEISGANASLIQSTDISGADPSADYAIFSGLTGASQTITTTIPAYGGIAGFQIVATPEPGTLALAAMGGIGILAFGRRFKARR
ncbi:MAG TPA: PEP-CTERM sorting domain-containing protein [Verrucomicrobiae bacterium]|jgi:hypothetical protein|nr:PEP-CTERM sorting domain-containing protein [Verrucomicrobiae bacterium]